MCDFISWVERKNANGTTDVLFLTDKEVFSKRGRKLFQACRDNDTLGHGAIRLYYGKDGEPLEGGKNCEFQDFWKTERLPTKIKNLHPEDPRRFMKHWGRMWRDSAFQNDDLIYIICDAPDPWKQKAWDRLLKQDPSNADLGYIIWNAPEHLKEQARAELKKRGASIF